MRRTEVGVSGEQLPLRLRQETRVPQERPLHRTLASMQGDKDNGTGDRGHVICWAL